MKRHHQPSVLRPLSFVLSVLLVLPVLPVLASRYGTLSPAATVIDAPPLVCTGYTIVTNYANSASLESLPSLASLPATNITVTTNGVWTATDSIPEPTANRLGYLLVVDTPPVTDTNHYAVATGWEERDSNYVVVRGEWPNQEPLTAADIVRRIYRVYSILPLPPPPARRIYKYDLSAACIEYGEITNLITFISADVGVKWMWDAAEILVEDDPHFVAATNEVVQAGIIPESKVKRILDRAYELGQATEAAK